MMEAANREYKDRLFKDIFSDRTRLLSLYNAVNGSCYTDPNALEMNTLADSVYAGMKNDISFLFRSELSLYEHQSSVNPNMPLRGLMYFARLYEKVLTQRGQTLYGRSVVRIPTPKFIVFYNGTEDRDDMTELRLSDAFEAADKSGRFEWTATMLNVNAGRNQRLMAQCEGLDAYSLYVERVRQNAANGMNRDSAIQEAVDWAVKEGLLRGYFKERKSEVIAMSIFEFNQEEYGRTLYQEGIEQGMERGMERGIKQGIERGIEQGIERGMEQGIENMVISLDKQGVQKEIIASAAKLSVSQVNDIILRKAVTA